jgi:hypothetical protein
VSPLEQFIIRHRTDRYLFVLISWPIAAVADRVRGIWNPADLHSLRNALGWARRGGDPAAVLQRPEPAQISPRWRGDHDETRRSQ